MANEMKRGRPRKYATPEESKAAQMEKYHKEHPCMEIRNLQGEIWKDIKGYDGYQVSNKGRVKSTIVRKEGKLLKPSVNKLGYLQLGLSVNGKPTTHYVHRLVAETFIPNPDKKLCIDHINTDRTDNRVENLRWCTHKENINNPLTKEKWRDTHKGRERLSTRGGKHFKAKKVQQFTKDGLFIKEWGTPKEASREMGFTSSINIVDCCNGKQKSAYGFIWKYVA
jgi:hypothetical protein